MHDLAEVAALLHIHKEALGHGQALANIRDGALKRLQTINADMTLKLPEDEAAPAPAAIAPPTPAPEPTPEDS